MILLFSPSATPGMFSLRTLASRSATTEKLEGPLSCCLSLLLSPAENQGIPANAKPGEDIYGWRLAIFRKNAYKKGAGRMLPTLPRQVRRASVPLVLRGYATCFKPSPGARRTGAFVLAYSRDEARSIRQRSVSSAKSTRRLMRLISLTRQAGVCAVPNAWEEAT